jgi:LacI family transcriptional regulator
VCGKCWRQVVGSGYDKALACGQERVGMATIRDVARQAGVSTTTVSATLNGSAPVSEALRKRVWDAVKAAGYQPDPVARHLRLGRSTAIGLIVPDISKPYAAHLAKSMQTALARLGYGMFFSSNDDDPVRELQDIGLFTSHRVAGLIIMATSLGEGYAERLTRTISTPTVLVDRVVAHTPFDTVADDNVRGAHLLFRYLVELGHRDIAILAGRASISSSEERVQGCLAAAAEAGISIPEAFIRYPVHMMEQAQQATLALMTQPRPPTAIMSINVAQTRGIMVALKQLGLSVPGDVSVVSFDGFHFSEGWTPAITSLTQDMDVISAKAAEFLLQTIDGAREQAEPRLLRVPMALQVRESSGPPPR